MNRSAWMTLMVASLPLFAQSSCPTEDQDEDGWTTADGDCDDTDPAVHPGAEEVCDGVDNSCDGTFDDLGSVCPASSCQAVLEANPDAASGYYSMDFYGDGVATEAYCDQDTDGGGWTGVTLELAYLTLNGTVEYTVQAPSSGIDSSYRPWTQDQGGEHSYMYTFDVPFGFTQFYLSDYVMKANAASGYVSDIYGPSFTQSTWDYAYGNTWGDVSFGSADEDGPVTSYAAYYVSDDLQCQTCEVAWPGGTTIYAVSDSSAFRMGFGEEGSEYEGWYPWWSGTIFVR